MHVAELQPHGRAHRDRRATAVVRGVAGLQGAPVMATDLRASAASCSRASRRRGRPRCSRVYHLDRGYERIEEKLGALGARIRRVQ